MMKDSLQHTLATLESISSVEDEAELSRLDRALSDLFTSSDPAAGVDSCLRIFERFPDKDGYGIFWGILHGVESIPGYEKALVESIKRQPSEFGLLMIGRLLNAGHDCVGKHDLLALLQEIAENEAMPQAVRSEAQGWIERQQRRT